MTFAPLLSLLLIAGPAHAARNEVSFEANNVVLTDDLPREIYGVSALPAPGLRVGVAALKDQQGFGLVVGAAWHRSQRGTQISGERSFDTFLTLDTVGVGLKADYDLLGVVFPYLRADAELLVTTHLTHDTAVTDEALAVNKRTGFAPAGRFTAGFEFMLPDRRWGWPVTAAVYVEGGYEVAGSTRLGDLGSLNFGGGLIAAGLGLRF